MMNFKEALIAHLQGEKVEAFDGECWRSIDSAFGEVRIKAVDDFGVGWKFRLAPRTIFVNGVEVSAPERVAPETNQYFFIPDFEMDGMFMEDYWVASESDNLLLERGLVYLNKEDAIARARAMLITSDKEDS